jgi:hemerythrin-like domain-containing protein
MNALDLLKKDHQEAARLMDQIETAADGGQNSGVELFNQLKNALTLHTRIEEQVFYPALENHQETRDLVKEAYTEHDEVKNLLSEISGLSPSSNDFINKLTELRDNVEHHVEEEENEMFPKVKQVLSLNQIDEIGRRMLEMKQDKSKTATTKRR